MVALCVRYLIADPDVSVVLVGAAAPAEIEESVFAAYEGPLPPDIHEAVEGIVAKDRW
jgi:predicted aldo/keto reductase-like oxidoreductase